MELDKIITYIFAAAVAFAPFINPILGYLQDRDKNKEEKAVRDANIASEIGQTWKEFSSTLKEDNKDLRERLEKAEKRIDQLEEEIRTQQKAYDENLRKLAVEYANKERGWQEAINGMTQRIQELEGEQKTIKKTTDELVKKTGPLPPLPGDEKNEA